MKNKGKTLPVRVLFGTILLLTVGVLGGLAFWAYSGTLTVNAQTTDSVLGLNDGAPAEDKHDDHEDHDEEREADSANHMAMEGPQSHDGDAHDEAEEGAHPTEMTLTPTEMEELSIVLAEAGPGKLDIQVSLPGEVRLNEDQLAHIVPKLSGIVKDVRVTLGDEVQAGEVVAVLESRDLARASAAYLAACQRLDLAQANFAREKELWEKKISAAKDFLEAKNSLAEARIVHTTAKQELLILGLAESDISGLAQQPMLSMTMYEIVAPFDGTIISKHIALGEFIEANADVFTLANLRTVWVDLSVYRKDLLAVREGLEVTLSASEALPETSAKIAYLGPLVGEETRTALARIVLPNPEGNWRPGLFVTARVAIDSLSVPVLVPRTALQNIDGKTQVFIRHEGTFEATPVTVGRADADSLEILGGLTAGQTYVASGSFHLKAEMEKKAFSGDGHGH